MKRYKKLICCTLLAGFLLSISSSAVFVNGGETQRTIYGYTYSFYSSIGKNDTTGEVYGNTSIESLSGTVPAGYMGACQRLFTSSGALSKSGEWRYNDVEATILVHYPIYAGKAGTYYSQGLVKFYDGDGYTTSLSTKASPNLQQYGRTNSPSLPTLLQSNSSGMTYGSALFSPVEPDLILAEGVSGCIGYVKSSDLNGINPSTIDEALTVQASAPLTRTIPLYTSDGTTIIDSFVVEKTLPIPQDVARLYLENGQL